MERGVFGAVRWGRAGWSMACSGEFFATRRPLSPACGKRQKSAGYVSFGPALRPEPPPICHPTLHLCHRRDGRKAPVHKGSRKSWHTHRTLQNDGLVTSTLQACHAGVTPLSCEKNLSRAMPCESKEWLVTSCIERKLPPFRPRNTPVGFAAICSICRIMKPRNCPTDLLLCAAHSGVRPHRLASRKCAAFAADFRGATA